jgi:hypothetical protein
MVLNGDSAWAAEAVKTLGTAQHVVGSSQRTHEDSVKPYGCHAALPTLHTRNES